MDTFELVWLGLELIIKNEAKGLHITWEHTIDKLTIRSGEHAIGIPKGAIRCAIEADRYDVIDNAVKNAVMYLRVLSYGLTRKARAFRAKRSSILVQSRFTRRGAY